MYQLFSGLKSLCKIDKVCIDNNVFRLHYKVTMILLMICSLINTSRQYIGDPIDCISSKGSEIPAHIWDTFCWITSTFSVKNKFGRVGVDMVYPGVSKYVEGTDEIKQHKYYQWVCFVLFFQAVLFYIPRYIWKTWEGGRTRALTTDLKLISLKENEMDAKCKILTEYFIRNLKHHNIFLIRFFICELLNLINVVGQIFLMDSFLGGEFSSYGLDVLDFMDKEQHEREDPMAKIFPRMTKCTMHKFGSSGSVEKLDALCILPINVVNEKMYIFLWFWFVILSAITMIEIIYRIVVMSSSKLRYYLLKSKLRVVSSTDIAYLCKRFKIGDWFMFYLVCKNTDIFALKKVVTDLVESIRDKQYVLENSKIYKTEVLYDNKA